MRKRTRKHIVIRICQAHTSQASDLSHSQANIINDSSCYYISNVLPSFHPPRTRKSIKWAKLSDTAQERKELSFRSTNEYYSYRKGSPNFNEMRNFAHDIAIKTNNKLNEKITTKQS